METEDKNKKRKPLIYYCLAAILVMVIFNAFVVQPMLRQNIESVTYDVFWDALDAGLITQVQIESTDIFYTTSDSSKVFTTVRVEDPDLTQRLRDADVTFSQIAPSQASSLMTTIISFLLWIGVFWLMWKFIFGRMGQGGNMMAFGKSNAKVYVKAQTGKTFADVAGQDEAKDSLREIVDFLHNPQKYTDIGAALPKGVLLVGPPGTGKTLLAQAVAGEAEVPFFSISGSEFVEMFVGMGAAKVRDLFKQANEKAPCIVFIDEIDTIGKKRDGAVVGGNDEREQTLNQLLSEMDGFDATRGVVILAATNRPETLDKALLRPGRFDRRIPVELPDLAGREAILRVHAKKVRMENAIDFGSIARATPGASGAELANIINEAALHAVRSGRQAVAQADLEESVEVVIAGEQRKNVVISQKEKEIVAYHEVGHALVAALQSDSAPVHKITIIPRTSGALGYTLQVDEDEHFLLTRDEAFNKIATLTGGRVAEELVFHTMTTGASNDIEQATRMARAMVSRYGMSKQFGMVALESMTNQYLGGDTSLSCSMETATRIDEEVVALVADAHEKATGILREHLDRLHLIAHALIEKETMSGEEFMALLKQPDDKVELASAAALDKSPADVTTE